MTAAAPYGPADPTDVTGKRFLAAVVDVGIGALISVPLFFLLSQPVYSYDPARGQLTQTRELAGAEGLIFVAWLLAYNVGVFVLQRGFTGRTVGTLLTGLAVVDEHGRPLGPGKAALRSIAGIVDYVPCACFPLVGPITILTTRGHRRVGDMAATSYVVDARGMGLPVVVPGPPGTVPMGATTAPTPMNWGPPPGAEAPTSGWSPPADSNADAAWSSYAGLPTSDADTDTDTELRAAATGGAPTPPPDRSPAPPTGSAPPQGSARPPGSGAPPAGPPTGPQPVWDPGRRAYMAWDPARQQWLQFDQGAQRWLLFDPVTSQWRVVEP